MSMTCCEGGFTTGADTIVSGELPLELALRLLDLGVELSQLTQVLGQLIRPEQQ